MLKRPVVSRRSRRRPVQATAFNTALGITSVTNATTVVNVTFDRPIIVNEAITPASITAGDYQGLSWLRDPANPRILKVTMTGSPGAAPYNIPPNLDGLTAQYGGGRNSGASGEFA